VIDDELQMLTAIDHLLTARGFTTQVFSSAEAFLAACTKDAACLVLDINLGGMSGIELRRRLASAGAQLPVLFITPGDDAATPGGAMAAGCVACLHKPFPADQLLGAIAKATRAPGPS